MCEVNTAKMAKFDIRELNYITCGKKQNTFNIAYCYTDDGHISGDVQKPASLSTVHTTTMFGDIGEFQTMSEQYGSNKCSFYDIDNKIIVHNLYDCSKSLLKTTAKKYGIDGNRDGNVDLFLPTLSSDFIGICQFQNFAYGLTPLTDQSPVALSIIPNNFGKYDSSYHYSLESRLLQTILYPRPSEVLAGHSDVSSYDVLVAQAGELSNYALSSIFKIRRSLDGIRHNYIVEFPEDTVQNQYYDGYIQCDMALAKNYLDSMYTMQVGEGFDISSCREYCNIDVCGDQLYMTYRDNVNYSSQLCGIGSEVQHFNMQESSIKTYGYQHVEVVDTWSRFDRHGAAGHKSSMFSIKLIDTGLNESTIDSQAKQKLRQNIQNSIRALVDSLAPANCQLFNIYFDGR